MNKPRASLALLSGLMIGCFGYLAFIFPKNIHQLKMLKVDLSIVQKLILVASNFCVSFGFFLLPILLIVFVASFITAFTKVDEVVDAR